MGSVGQGQGRGCSTGAAGPSLAEGDHGDEAGPLRRLGVKTPRAALNPLPGRSPALIELESNGPWGRAMGEWALERREW
jgi:hypothetical protein